MEWMFMLTRQAWKQWVVPEDWMNAIIAPYTKEREIGLSAAVTGVQFIKCAGKDV